MKNIVAFFAMHFLFTIAMEKLCNEKIIYKKKRFYISFLITFVLLVCNFEFSPSELRVIFNILIYILLAFMLFQKTLKESIILGMLVIIVNLCAEFIYVIATYPIFHYGSVLTENAYIVFINNLIIGIISIILSSLKKVKNLFVNILNSINKIGEKHIILFSLLIVIFFNFSGLVSYYVSLDLIDSYYLVFIGSFLCIFTSVLVFYYFKTQSKYLSVYEKYNVSLESIRQFEAISQRYHIDSHEVKNQFRTIRNMSKNKKIVSYIDALLDEESTDDEQIYMKVLPIPPGGLRGIVYTKLLIMKNKNIFFELNVDKKVTNDLVQSIDDCTLTNICRILGVFLDNAIEAVSSLSEQYIIIEIYNENGFLNIDITNNYEGYVDMEEISNPGISTKGKNHGYGLSLVKELVKKNYRLCHESQIIEDNFMQKLKIKV